MQLVKFALITGLLSLAQANDVIFYSGQTCSSGSYSGCYGIAARVCCSTSGRAEAISVSKSSSSDVAAMYSGGGCTTQKCVRATHDSLLGIVLTRFFPLPNRVPVLQERFAVSGMAALCLPGDIITSHRLKSAMI